MEAASVVLLSYQDVLSRALDVVSNNIANASTTGYKRQDVQFETFITRPQPNEKLNFVYDRATFRDMDVGAMTKTGNPLDLAIAGQGFFQIQTKSGTQYTRAGSFQMNANGEIVTPQGDKLLGDGGQPLVIGPDAEGVMISSDGVISVTEAGSATQIGKIKVVKFANEQELQNVGGGLFKTSQTPQDALDSGIEQGVLERSNVESVTEMSRMLKVLRSYQQTAKMMDAETQRLTSALARLSKATA